MKLICKLMNHRPGPEVWNEGLRFATCTRCGMDIIRPQGGRWTVVPGGLRVAWHPAGHQGVHWSKAISRARERRLHPQAAKTNSTRSEKPVSKGL